jgi:hypothetical protein
MIAFHPIHRQIQKNEFIFLVFHFDYFWRFDLFSLVI